jgi:glycosyltransferase involved in cell wall biosynthesis
MSELSPLPKVSVVTITRNRKDLFFIAVDNWKRIDYPPELLEWVIIDDSTTPYCLKDILPSDDERIHYHWIPPEEREKLLDETCPPNTRGAWYGWQRLIKALSIPMKRNYSVEKASHEIIAHMDDDDFYPAESVRERVSALLNAEKRREFTEEKQSIDYIVACTEIQNMELRTGNMFSTERSIALVPNETKEQVERRMRFPSVAEATMCYRRRAWKRSPYDPLDSGQEGDSFILGTAQAIEMGKRGAGKESILKAIKAEQNRRYVETIPNGNVIVSIIHGGNSSTRNKGNKIETIQATGFIQYIRRNYIKLYRLYKGIDKWIGESIFDGKKGSYSSLGCDTANKTTWFEKMEWECVKLSKEEHQHHWLALKGRPAIDVILLGAEPAVQWIDMMDLSDDELPKIIISEQMVDEGILNFMQKYEIVTYSYNPQSVWLVRRDLLIDGE